VKELFQKLSELLGNGDDTVLVTIISKTGPTPRGVGARMLVTAKGRMHGTIGGGMVEYKSEQAAHQVLQTKNSRTEFYRLDQAQIQDIGMICGGEVYIHFLYIKADISAISLVAEILSCFERCEQSWLISDVTPGQCGTISCYGKNRGLVGAQFPDTVIEQLGNKAVLINVEGREYYCEKISQAGIVYVFGGGHVSQALAPILTSVGFRYKILEDRKEFCRKNLFPGAEETILISKNLIFDHITITDNDYIVIMTRGHKDDQVIMAEALKTAACYIGVMGSRHKAAIVANNLREMGYSDHDLSRIISPIGLYIHADTPAEIAISIAAQLIEHRALRNE